MLRKKISIVLILALLISVLPINALAASDYYSYLRRDVTFTAADASNGSPLYDVNYRIYQGDSYRIDMGTTTSVTRLEPGRYTITATKDGYYVGTRTIDVTSSNYMQYFEFKLNRDTTRPLPTSNTLYLKTLDASTGYNISDVRYFIEDLNNSSKNQTIYSSSVNLPVGNYRVSAIREGYTTQSKSVYMTGSRQDVTFNLSRNTLFPISRDFKITNVSVYSSRVIGNTAPYAKVNLYKSGNFVKSATADSAGYFEILNTFGRYFSDSRYYGTRIYPDVNTSTRVRGYTNANTPVIVYDENNTYLGSTVSDYRGFYEISHNYVSNPERKVIYRNYYNDNYSYEDIKDYYLVAEKDGYSSSRFYLTDGEVKDSSLRPPTPSIETATAPVILEALAGESFVRGEKATPFATITIRDASGEILGTTTLDYYAKFAIRTKRPLISGELLTITTSHERYVDKISSVVVGAKSTPEKSGDTFDYINKFTIGSKSFVRIKDTQVTTEHMDVAPYITNGRTMLPIRFVAESLGYEVSFDDNTKNAVFVKGETSLIMNLRSRDFYVNGKKHTLSVDPVTVEGRIMLPVSELGKALGLTHGNIGEGKNIEWDGANSVVIIQIKN